MQRGLLLGEKTIFELVTDIMGMVLSLGIFIFLIIYWKSIPDQIPTHYSASGVVDKMGSKNIVWILPIINLVTYLFFMVIEHFPQLWNTGVMVTEENRIRVFRVTKSLIHTMKLLMVILFVYLSFAISVQILISMWIMGGFMILFFVSIAFHLIRLYMVR